jgi:hypothetical protein
VSPMLRQRVRYWDGKREGKADGVGTITDGPRWDLGRLCWFVVHDEGGSSVWHSEAQIEAELPGGRGVKS